MKKKKITGKLNLKKNKISSLESNRIQGGGTYLGSACYPECMTFPALCNGGSYGVDCDPTVTLSQGGGSECKCK